MAALQAEASAAATKANMAEITAKKETKRADALAKSAFWRGAGAIVASIGSFIALAVALIVWKTVRSYLDEPLEKATKAAEVAEESKADLEARIEVAEESVANLRTEVKSELRAEFSAIRFEIRSALEHQSPPPAKTKRGRKG